MASQHSNRTLTNSDTLASTENNLSLVTLYSCTDLFPTKPPGIPLKRRLTGDQTVLLLSSLCSDDIFYIYLYL